MSTTKAAAKYVDEAGLTLPYARLMIGEPDESKAMLTALNEQDDGLCFVLHSIGHLGDDDWFFNQANKCMSSGYSFHFFKYLRTDAVYEKYHQDPRWLTLLAELEKRELAGTDRARTAVLNFPAVHSLSDRSRGKLNPRSSGLDSSRTAQKSGPINHALKQT